MIVKMIQNLGNRMEKIEETFNKDLEELKSKQKNSLQTEVQDQMASLGNSTKHTKNLS